MTEEAEITEDAEIENEPDFAVNLSPPDAVAYDELVENFGEELINADLAEVIKKRVRSLYDNQDEIKQKLAQAQQQQQGGPQL